MRINSGRIILLFPISSRSYCVFRCQDVPPTGSSRRRRPSLSRNVFRYPGGTSHNQFHHAPALSRMKNSSTLPGFEDSSHHNTSAYEDDGPIGMRGLQGPIAMSALFNHHHNLDKSSPHVLSNAAASPRALSSYSAIAIDSMPHY